MGLVLNRPPVVLMQGVGDCARAEFGGRLGPICELEYGVVLRSM